MAKFLKDDYNMNKIKQKVLSPTFFNFFSKIPRIREKLAKNGEKTDRIHPD